jgi:hypothetical protein
MPSSINPLCDIVEYASKRLTLFWYSAATEAKQTESNPVIMSNKEL